MLSFSQLLVCISAIESSSINLKIIYYMLLTLPFILKMLANFEYIFKFSDTIVRKVLLYPTQFVQRCIKFTRTCATLRPLDSESLSGSI